MELLADKKYSFVSKGYHEDTFGVVDFKGDEGVSQCYEFEITLVSGKADIDMEQVLESPAVLTIHRPDNDDIDFNGVLASFEQHHEVGGYAFYKAVLVPKFWWLRLTHHNQVFLKKTLPEIFDAVLKDGGMTGKDYELRLKNDYREWEYVCQYRESHFEFLSRWMERDGVYYYFEQHPEGEKLIVTDTNLAHTFMDQGKTMYYSPPSGLDSGRVGEIIQSLVCRQQMMPKSILLKDYNYETPSLEMTGRADVSPRGRGEVYLYGEHFFTPEEGDRLAGIRAEEYLCRKQLFVGDSYIPYLRPGYRFELSDHYKQAFNQEYLTIAIHHEGSQVGYLISGLRRRLSEREEQLFYRNTFTAIPSGIQFRPERKTEKARFYGSMNAKIDAAGSGKYAELDEEGRYKVVLPFDLSGRKDGKASTFLRMMQPYSGPDRGMHFPLPKGTEVLLTFIDGDPDRPVIAGAVPNPVHPSVVNSSNQTQNLIATGGKNKIHLEDKEGSERILMQTPTQDTWFRMGAPNDPPAAVPTSEFGNYNFNKKDEKGKGKSSSFTDGFMFNTSGSLNGIINQDYKVNIGGNSTKITVGGDESFFMGFKLGVSLALEVGVKLGGHADFKPWYVNLRGETNKLEGEVNELKASQAVMAGTIMKLKGDQTDLTGQVTRLQGDVTDLNGSQTTLQGEVTRLEGSQTALQGEVTDLQGAHTQLKGEVTEIKGSQTELSGEVTRLSGDVNEMAGAQTAMAGEVTRLDGETTSLAGSVSQLAGLINMM